MLPVPLIASLERSNAESEPPEGAEMAPPRGRRPFICALSCSPRRAGHRGSFIFVWRDRERDFSELRGAHLVGGNGAAVVGLSSGERPRLLSSRAVRSVSHGPDCIPLWGYVTGPPWTMGAVHGRSVGRSTRTVVNRANPSTPRGPPVGQRRGQPRTAGDFAL